jgi:hypothetical protein
MLFAADFFSRTASSFTIEVYRASYAMGAAFIPEGKSDRNVSSPLALSSDSSSPTFSSLAAFAQHKCTFHFNKYRKTLQRKN